MRNNSRKDLVKLKEWLKVVEFGVSAEALSKSRGASTAQPKVQSSDWIALCRLTAEVRNVGILCKCGSAVRIKDKEVSIGTSCNRSHGRSEMEMARSRHMSVLGGVDSVLELDGFQGVSKGPGLGSGTRS